MKNQLKSIFGIYESLEDAKSAVSELHARGFYDRDISLLVHAENVDKDSLSPEKHTRTPHGLTIGALGGAVVGGSLGILAGLGALVIPGIGPMLAIGPIFMGLSGAGMGTAAGGLAGALIGAGIPSHRVDEIKTTLQEGGILLSVHVEDGEFRKLAYDILVKTHAHSISTSEHESVSSVDDLSPSFDLQASSPKDDFVSRKQF